MFWHMGGKGPVDCSMKELQRSAVKAQAYGMCSHIFQVFEKQTSTQNCCIYLAIDFNCNLVPSSCKHKAVTIFWVATEAWTFSFSNGYKKHESNHQLYRLGKKSSHMLNNFCACRTHYWQFNWRCGSRPVPQDGGIIPVPVKTCKETKIKMCTCVFS
jgi:hypothetical protein